MSRVSSSAMVGALSCRYRGGPVGEAWAAVEDASGQLGRLLASCSKDFGKGSRSGLGAPGGFEDGGFGGLVAVGVGEEGGPGR